jgi:putative ABC transport system permease protein
MGLFMRDAWWQFSEAVSFLVRGMFQDRWRTGITLLNLLIFLCCYFCLAALAKASNEYGHQDGERNTLLVISKGIFNPGDSTITEADFVPIRELEPGQVASVSPLIFKLLKIDEYLIQVCGARQHEFEPVFALRLTQGSWPATDNDVLVSEGAMRLTKWKLGQTIKIFGKPFVIAGAVSAPGTKASSVWMTLPQAEKLFDTHGVYQFAWVQVAEGVNARDVREALQSDSRLNARYDVFFVDALYQQYAEALQGIRDISMVLVGFALVMVTFGTYGSVYLTLSERSREIAILRAIGFSSLTIRGLLMIRSLLQVIAAFIGSWGISAFLLARFNLLSPLTVNSLPLVVSIDAQIMGIGLGLALLFGCIGVWLPTIRLNYATVHESIQR